MKKHAILHLTVYILTALLMVTRLLLLLPFFAQTVQDISPKLYIKIYLESFTLSTTFSSLILALPLSYFIIKTNPTGKTRIILIAILLIMFISLLSILYFNLPFLAELMVRPSYE